MVRTTGGRLEWVFLGAYLLSLVLVLGGLVAHRPARSTPTAGRRWRCVAAFTLRHRITRTSANSLEPYFHPRMLAFGLGLLALAAFVRRRHCWPWRSSVAAAAVHVTTGLWFAVLVGVAHRRPGPALAARSACRRRVAGVAVAGWALLRGPAARAARTSWTPCGCRPWPARTRSSPRVAAVGLGGQPRHCWACCGWRTGGAPPAAARRRRTRRSCGAPRRSSALFLITLPAVAARVAFPVQLQIPRVFWLVDVVATVYAGRRGGRLAAAGAARAAALAMCLAAVAAGRGVYIMFVERPERPLFADPAAGRRLARGDAWLAHQPPGHPRARRSGPRLEYGTSVRVAPAATSSSKR